MHRLIAIDGLQHQKVGELRRGASPGRGDESGKRFASLMQQPEQFARERCQAIGRPHVHDRGNEILVEHDLFVGPAFNRPARAARRHTLR